MVYRVCVCGCVEQMNSYTKSHPSVSPVQLSSASPAILFARGLALQDLLQCRSVISQLAESYFGLKCCKVINSKSNEFQAFLFYVLYQGHVSVALNQVNPFVS